ncbi:hypothetical protein QA612_09720 [Evansella sp. AB-P1]|uniref:hypothetical protein n=1 Tax=Evansella sp. AB-P1 TaxID=3037653 RepID=UPI00241C6526|nr:hypothetical protein [Evansella sp. AB-P1]MDG5787777.1 hypothetical protein [Evansella sp. AB-P1]
MNDELKYLIYELKGMVDMLNVHFEMDNEVSYSQFDVVHSKVTELANKISEKEE